MFFLHATEDQTEKSVIYNSRLHLIDSVMQHLFQVKQHCKM